MATRRGNNGADKDPWVTGRYFSESSDGGRNGGQSPYGRRRDSFDPSNYGSKPPFNSGYSSVKEDDFPVQETAYSQQPVQEESTMAYSRRVTQAEYTQRRKKGRRRKILISCLIVVLVLCLGGAGAAFALFGTVAEVEENFIEGIDDSLWNELIETDLTKEPFYVLLLGTDKSEERDGSVEYGDSFRADSIILTRIDPIENKATLVSLHRDIIVDMGTYGKEKLNTAYALGGPTLVTKVVSELAGVKISHYAEVNFDGFKEVVDVLGGIEVYVPMEIDDDDAGGYVPAGQQTLNGEQALILSRARHAYDEYGDGDKFRAANQRLVLGAIAKKVLSSDIGTIASTVTTLSENVTTTLKVMDMVGLAQSMQGMDPSTDLYSGMTPTDPQLLGDGWYEILLVDEWKAMMARVDKGLPPNDEDIIDEASGTILATAGSGETKSKTDVSEKKATVKRVGRVVVKNGSGAEGVASGAAGKIEPLGYTIVETSNANSFDYATTLVVYSSGDKADAAKEIVDALGVGRAVLNQGEYLLDEDFLVVVGADWS